MTNPLYVGTAGWGLPKSTIGAFSEAGSILERYASRFNAVEINSSFYRAHKRATYERWARAVPVDFRFSVKAPRQVTHERRLVGTASLLAPFLEQILGLGPKLGPVLIQLPPSLAFDHEIAAEFLAAWRAQFDGPTVCEPRHVSWFSAEANRCLIDHRIVRAAVDPPPCAAATKPGGSAEGTYFRLHGSPLVYQSPYGADRLKALAPTLTNTVQIWPTWCIFDNTKFGAATEDALILMDLAP